jgi:hypothetical protein
VNTWIISSDLRPVSALGSLADIRNRPETVMVETTAQASRPSDTSSTPNTSPASVVWDHLLSLGASRSTRKPIPQNLPLRKTAINASNRTSLDPSDSKKPAGRGLRGSHRTSSDFLKQQCGGPGGIRTHYRSIMSRQLIPIKLPALLQENALPRVTKPTKDVERCFRHASNSIRLHSRRSASLP